MAGDEAARRWVDRSSLHWRNGDLDAALRCSREALALDPRNVDALANTGTLLWIKGDREEAERFYLAAHAVDPTHVGAIVNIATLHNDAADVESALRWLDMAAALAPRNPEVVWRKGITELALGDYANGWSHYEAGLGIEGIRGRSPGFTSAPWNGERCERLLLWHEQGFGDTLQFVRYAKLCRERASKVLVLCPKELGAIVRSCPYVDGADTGIDAGGFDRQVSIMSLPHVFGTTLPTVPAPIPYLFADPADAKRWAARMPGDRLRVGLVWAGKFRSGQSRYRIIDANRSMPLAAMQPLLDIPCVDFYSLQKGLQQDEEAREARGKLIDFMGEVDDFAQTAAIIENLDLVISVDTAVVHLAGAMGKPVWVLSRLDACWRWLRNRPDSPWYPTARVYGQTARGEWARVIERVATELAKVTTSKISS